MDVLEAIRTRPSVAELGGEVDDATICRLIQEAAVWAPNHHHTEPWHFTVLKGQARARVGLGWAKTAAAEIPIDGAAREKYIAKESQKLLRAPVVVVVSQRVSGTTVQIDEDHAAVSAAIQNLLLAAHGLGLGARWRTGKMAYHPAMLQLLGLPDTSRIVGFIYLGYTMSEEMQPRHRNLEGLIDWQAE